MVEKVISGGQTGVDRLGLEVAQQLGIPTGGTAPKSFRTENGSDYSLKEFGLVEDFSYNYQSRTEKNVVASDGTVIFGSIGEPGTKFTIELCKKHKKEYLTNPTSDEIREFIKEYNIKVLNIAGNRGSKLSINDIERYRKSLHDALSY